MARERPRAIGIVRVSHVGGREGERFSSPTEQANRIRSACENEGLELLSVEEEMDVSGGRDVDDRPGLGAAVRAIEDGRAEVIVGAYFDRLFRSLKAQRETLERVERAGGRVLAVDVGTVSDASAGQWLTGTLMGAVSEYLRRATAERVRGGIQAAIDRGVPPFGHVPIGYVKNERGVYLPGPLAPAVAESFRMRADGSSSTEVWGMLRDAGASITAGGIYQMWRKRVYLGEIHFGSFTPNLAAHEPIVDVEMFDRAQRMRAPVGRKGKSVRLLARLGVLRCGSCDARMVGSVARNRKVNGSTYPIYRCNNRACTGRMSIMAWMADEAVRAATVAAFSRHRGKADADGLWRRARDAWEAQSVLVDRLIAVLDPFEPAARDRLAVETGERERLRDEFERLGGERREVDEVVDLSDWDAVPVSVRRDHIVWAWQAVRVGPGRGRDRLDFEPRV